MFVVTVVWEAVLASFMKFLPFSVEYVLNFLVIKMEAHYIRESIHFAMFFRSWYVRGAVLCEVNLSDFSLTSAAFGIHTRNNKHQGSTFQFCFCSIPLPTPFQN